MSITIKPEAMKRLNKVVSKVCAGLKAPENITVSEWADKYRVLSPENSAEAGKWKTSRTPYLKDIMDSFTDDRVKKIYVVASSQVGKTEMENCIIGYIIDQDPGTIVFAHPKIDQARNFSKRRIDPMVRDTPPLRKKVKENRNAKSTLQLKTFPGGALIMVGTQSAKDLAETPARYVIGDEVDRWPKDVDGEGDPWGLLEARTTTFYNAKMVAVSTPTVKGDSAIESLFNLGTQEYWSAKCPACGEYHYIQFKDIDFKHETRKIGGRKQFTVTDIRYMCPVCGCFASETEMRRTDHKWIAENPEAINNGVKSYWLNGFSSPWASWESIILQFLEADGDPSKLQTVFNTKFGELWEDRGDLVTDDEIYDRREEYAAELPDGVLCLTCGVDTQGDRLEYEVVGHGYFGEKWGIEKGTIPGNPGTPDSPGYQSVWTRLDGVIDRKWTFANGKQLKISLTFIDHGGNHTQDVNEACAARINKRVFAIKGKGGEGIPYVPEKASKIDIKRGNAVIGKLWLYVLGVDEGKQAIMDSLKVQEPGARYYHFPNDPDKGYTKSYFDGLLSEKLCNVNGKWRWEKLPGHERNEPLDCRNYANAAFRVLNPNLERLETEIYFPDREKEQAPKVIKKQRRRRSEADIW